MIKVQVLLSLFLRKNSLIGKIQVSKTLVKGSSPFFFVIFIKKINIFKNFNFFILYNTRIIKCKK